MTANFDFRLGRHAIAAWARHRIKSEMVAFGYTDEQATRLVGQIGDGTIVNWLWDHRMEILQFVLAILPLFLAKEPPAGVAKAPFTAAEVFTESPA